MDNLSLVEIIDRTRLVSDVPNPILPFCCPIPDGNLRPGSLITVYGTCPTNQGRFRIDLYASNCQHCRSDDGKTSVYDPAKRIVALHFNGRFNEAKDGSSYVVMNSFHNGKWDQDERSTVFPFQPEQPFCMMILIEEQRFRIYIDGGERPHYQFEHRFSGEKLLRQDLVGFENCVERIVPKMDADKFAALVSFAYNLGCGSLEQSTLAKYARAHNYRGAANEFPKWCHAGGKVLQGLVRRRAAERALFCKSGGC
ncbi:hypothetical protein BLA29_000467 [Euroglyphus maynei]|uniref:Galectin n=1 Tax=Euroglyphus maynei TaxID=6958 RepID=A0A1Y3B3E7_EURMA|nr:hypothetical protein BLA29_000467 [Euroglyphus maynei]